MLGRHRGFSLYQQGGAADRVLMKMLFCHSCPNDRYGERREGESEGEMERDGDGEGRSREEKTQGHVTRAEDGSWTTPRERT